MNTPAPRIAFLGTPEFSIPILEKLALLNRPSLIVTTPADPKKGPSPVEQWGSKNAIRVIAPDNLAPEVFNNEKFDLFIIAAYGKLLKKSILTIPRFGTLNIHPSLLPLYRGASPIQGALLAGERMTGVTIMLTDTSVDHGPIIAQQELPIAPTDTSISLSQKLSELGGELLQKIIADYLAGVITPREQDHERATYTKLLTRDDGAIDWEKSADTIERMIRAYLIWPGSFTVWDNMRIKILRAHTAKTLALPIGTFYRTKDGSLIMAAHDGCIVVEELQPEGKKPMSAGAFINGHKKEIPELEDEI